MKKTSKYIVLAAALLASAAAVTVVAPVASHAAESSYKFIPVFTSKAANMLARIFNTTTGHDHDGTNSKQVVSVDATATYTAAGVRVTELTASATGYIQTGAASKHTDYVELKTSAGTVVWKIGKSGHTAFRQYAKASVDTLVPDFIGALIQCTDCTLPYTVCRATGTAAAQWATTHGTGGCGTNN